MRRILGTALLLLAFPMFAGGVFEMEGLMGPPNLSRAIALSLGAQATVLTAGYVAAPKSGKVGFFRAAAFVFYFVQSLGIPVALFALLYSRFVQVELLESTQLIWTLVNSVSALFLLLFSAKVWNLSLARSGSVTTR